MYKLLVCSFLAMAAAAPIEDTPEVAEAKATFNAAFTAAEAGEHIALRPVNSDVQAAQIASAYLDDAEDVPAANPFNAGFPINGLGYAGIPYTGLGLGYNGLGFPYAGLPLVPAAAPAAEE